MLEYVSCDVTNRAFEEMPDYSEANQNQKPTACVLLPVSFGITLRPREVGLRLALGARRTSTLKHLLAQALVVCAIRLHHRAVVYRARVVIA